MAMCLRTLRSCIFLHKRVQVLVHSAFEMHIRILPDYLSVNNAQKNQQFGNTEGFFRCFFFKKPNIAKNISSYFSHYARIQCSNRFLEVFCRIFVLPYPIANSLSAGWVAFQIGRSTQKPSIRHSRCLTKHISCIILMLTKQALASTYLQATQHISSPGQQMHGDGSVQFCLRAIAYIVQDRVFFMSHYFGFGTVHQVQLLPMQFALTFLCSQQNVLSTLYLQICTASNRSLFVPFAENSESSKKALRKVFLRSSCSHPSLRQNSAAWDTVGGRLQFFCRVCFQTNTLYRCQMAPHLRI